MKPFSIFILLLFICQLSFSQVQSDKPLISFTLSKYNPKEGNTSSGSSVYTQTERIFTGNEASPYKDTLVEMHESNDEGINILGLYRKALDKVLANRIIYAKNVSYVESFDPHYKYNVNFSYSGLMGDYASCYLGQLNSAFGLTTRTVQKRMEVLVLKNVIVNDSTIKYGDGLKISSSISVGTQVKMILNNFRNPQLICQLEGTIGVPVFDGMSESMCLTIHLETKMESRDIDSWIAFFKKHGIILKKEIREVNFIEIIKNTSVQE